MLAWSEGTDNGRQKTDHGYDVIVGGRAIYWLLRSPRKLVTLNPKAPNQRARTLPSFFPVGRMPCRKPAWPERLLSEKSGRCWHCSRLRSVALLWLIVVISVRQSTVAQQYLENRCRALVVVGSSIRLTTLIAKFEKAGGTVREIDVWAESPRLSHALVIPSSSPCRGLLIITVITPIAYKASATKNARRTEAGERGNYWHADASAWCCCARCQNTKS